MTPASIVNVTPLLTVTGAVRLYGLFALVHVVFVLIVPETSEACAVLKRSVLTKINPIIIIAVKNVLKSDLLFTRHPSQ